MRLPQLAFLLAFLSLQLAVHTHGQSTIASFEDSGCSTPEYNMFPQSINFDATKPECLLIRDDTTRPIVDSFDAIFYASAEHCRSGNPIVVNYSSSGNLPVTPMPLFPSPLSNQNLTFCFDSVRLHTPTKTSRFLTMSMRYTPEARSRLGLTGAVTAFLCPLESNALVFSQHLAPSTLVSVRTFIRYSGPIITFGLPMFITNSSKLVQYQPLDNTQACSAGSCCTTGSGPTTMHFKVNASSVKYRTPTKAYGKVLSCTAGNLMFQTYNDDKCTIGENVPNVLKADGSCQMTASPAIPQGDWNRRDDVYGYGTYYKGRCAGDAPPAKAPSVSVSAFFDSSCSRPNVDISPSPVNCDTSQCCLIAKRSGVNFLDGGIAHFFASAANCQNNVTAHPLNMSADVVSMNNGAQTRLNISGFPFGFWMPPSRNWDCECNKLFPPYHPSLSSCQCPLYRFGADSRYFSRIFPRKPRLLLCFHNNPADMKNIFFLGYFAQYLGDGKWSFDIRMFSDDNCNQQIFADTSVSSDRMCATDTCCRAGNSTASFFFRIPSSMLVFDNKLNDLYGRLMSCNGDVAMFLQFEDSACSTHNDGDGSPMLPRVLRADGSCAAVPSSDYAIDSYYKAECTSKAPLVQSVSLSAFSDSSCASPSTAVLPQAITCPINQCCLVRQAAGSRAAVYGRALSCNPQVMLFNTYADSQCTISNQYTPMVVRSDDSCQVDQTGYTQFYRASCKMLPTPPASPPSVVLPCPKDAQGNVCGGSELGTCSQVVLASGARIATCVCVAGKGFFDGRICISAATYSAVVGQVNKTFAQQQQQADLLNALSCADRTKPVKCPSSSWVAAQKSGQCQTSMAACAASAADFRTYLEGQAKLCAEGTRFDHVLMQCIASEAPRTPVFSCPAGMMRCSDGSCDATCAAIQPPACPSGSTGSFLCPGNQVVCAASLSECSKNQPWNGCPVNRIQCPNRPGICVASLQDCASAPGPFSCPDNVLSTWCGDLRDLEGKLILGANGKAQSKCVAQNEASTCPPIPNLAAKAVPKVQSITANAAAAVTALGSDNEPIATLDIPANTVSDVSFVVSPVADSVYQAGAFAALFSAGKLRSPLVSISPNAIVDTRAGGITLSLAVDIPAASCVNASSNMKGFAISEASAGISSSSPDEMSQCIGSVQNGKCMCKFVVTHFSTFTVGDSHVLDAASPAVPPAPSKGSPDNIIAAVAGGVVGGVALVVIVAFVIIKMKQRNAPIAPVQPTNGITQTQQISKPAHEGVAGGDAAGQGIPQFTTPQDELQLKMQDVQKLAALQQQLQQIQQSNIRQA